MELGYSPEDVAEAERLGFTLDPWGRYAMPGEWRLPPGLGDDSSGTRGLNAAGLTPEQVSERFALAHRLDRIWQSSRKNG